MKASLSTKEFLGIFDAAEYLSIEIGQDITHKDILHAFTEGKIILGYNALNLDAYIIDYSAKPEIYDKLDIPPPSYIKDNINNQSQKISGVLAIIRTTKLIATIWDYCHNVIHSNQIMLEFALHHDEYMYHIISDNEKILALGLDINRIMVHKEDLNNLTNILMEIILSKPKRSIVKDTLPIRERESLLKIALGMAIKGYSYDPKRARNDAISEICSDLEQLGMSVSDDTIRKYLNEAKEFLSPEAL